MWLNCSINAVEVRLKMEFKGTKKWMDVHNSKRMDVHNSKRMDVHNSNKEADGCSPQSKRVTNGGLGDNSAR